MNRNVLSCVFAIFFIPVLSPSGAKAQDQSNQVILPAGTLLRCTLNEPNFSSKTAVVGDPVLCPLGGVLVFERVAFSRGAYLGGHLEAEKDPGHFFGKGYLKLEFDHLGLPGDEVPLAAKIIAASKYHVDKEGKIIGHGHATRDTVEWTIPPLWPLKVLTLPARGPRPGLRGEEQLTLRLMDDVAIPVEPFIRRHSFQRSVEVPNSSSGLSGDVGVRAHTNHLILLRPERIRQAQGENPVGETPGSLACVYELVPSSSVNPGCRITGNPANGNNGLAIPSGGSQTIAIVDAYDDPTAYSDLSMFSRQFDLPVLPLCSSSPPVATRCFQQVYASGTKPATDGGWALEEALDIEWAHAMAPHAKIVLVEASSDTLSALFQAVTVASQQATQNGGAGEVSMSWGSSEFSSETSYDSYFQAKGVVYFAAAGDTGGTTNYPSVSPYVVSAGGTTVNRNSTGDFVSETAWSSGGGGPSSYEPIPDCQAFQPSVANLVGTKRGTPDMSFDADPNSGVFVYDSTPYNGSEGWWLVGGTSLAAPALAGIVNLANSFNPSSIMELELIYSICGDGPSTKCVNAGFRDVISGSSGSYKAAIGWDFTTGVGSSLGLGGK